MAVTRNADGAAHHRDLLGALRLARYHRHHHRPLDADDSRFMALTEDDDLVASMTDGDPLGAAISVIFDGKKNTALWRKCCCYCGGADPSGPTVAVRDRRAPGRALDRLGRRRPEQ